RTEPAGGRGGGGARQDETAGQHVERRQLRGEDDGMAVGQDHHRGGEADAPRERRDVGERRDDLEDGGGGRKRKAVTVGVRGRDLVREDQVLGGPEDVVPESVGRRRDARDARRNVG